MDEIYYRYRGTMVDFNGNEFEVDWAAADPNADDFTLVTPFRSGIWADTRPYYIGDIGEIPARFYPASRQVVPARICLNCYIGNNSWWESGWPLGTPAVVLAPDGWPAICDAGGPMFDCSCSALAVDYFPNPLYPVSACSCSTVEAEYTAHAHFAVNVCSCSSEVISYGDHVEIGVNLCSCSSPAVEYTQTAYFAVSACSCSKPSLMQTASVTHAVSVCSCSTPALTWSPDPLYLITACTCSTPSLTYQVPMPLVTYGCATVLAAGTTQATATLIADDLNSITNGNGFNGVRLPSGCYCIFIFQDSGGMPPTTTNLYPPVGENFETHAVNAPLSLNAGTITQVVRSPNGVWHYNSNWI